MVDRFQLQPIALALALALCACESVDLSNKKCDGEHPCFEAWRCVDSICIEECQSDSDCFYAPICRQGLCFDSADAGLVDAGNSDAGSLDAGNIDAGPLDSGPPDSGPLDSGPPDSGPLDSGPLDAGPLDAGPLDAGPIDAGPIDAGNGDAGVNDAGNSDAGVNDAGISDAGTSDAGLDAGEFIECRENPREYPCATGCCESQLDLIVGGSSVYIGSLNDPQFDLATDNNGNIWLFLEGGDGSVARFQLDGDTGFWTSEVLVENTVSDSVHQIEVVLQASVPWTGILYSLNTVSQLRLSGPSFGNSTTSAPVDAFHIVALNDGTAFAMSLEDDAFVTGPVNNQGNWTRGNGPNPSAAVESFDLATDGTVVQAAVATTANGKLFRNLGAAIPVTINNMFLVDKVSLGVSFRNGQFTLLGAELSGDAITSPEPTFGNAGVFVRGDLIRIIGSPRNAGDAFEYTTLDATPMVGVLVQDDASPRWRASSFSLSAYPAGTGANFKANVDPLGFTHIIYFDRETHSLHWTTNRSYPWQ